MVTKILATAECSDADYPYLVAMLDLVKARAGRKVELLIERVLSSSTHEHESSASQSIPDITIKLLTGEADEGSRTGERFESQREANYPLEQSVRCTALVSTWSLVSGTDGETVEYRVSSEGREATSHYRAVVNDLSSRIEEIVRGNRYLRILSVATLFVRVFYAAAALILGSSAVLWSLSSLESVRSNVWLVNQQHPILKIVFIASVSLTMIGTLLICSTIIPAGENYVRQSGSKGIVLLLTRAVALSSEVRPEWKNALVTLARCCVVSAIVLGALGLGKRDEGNDFRTKLELRRLIDSEPFLTGSSTSESDVAELFTEDALIYLGPNTEKERHNYKGMSQLTDYYHKFTKGELKDRQYKKLAGDDYFEPHGNEAIAYKSDYSRLRNTSWKQERWCVYDFVWNDAWKMRFFMGDLSETEAKKWFDNHRLTLERGGRNSGSDDLLLEHRSLGLDQAKGRE